MQALLSVQRHHSFHTQDFWAGDTAVEVSTSLLIPNAAANQPGSLRDVTETEIVDVQAALHHAVSQGHGP